MKNEIKGGQGRTRDEMIDCTEILSFEIILAAVLVALALIW